MEMSIGNFTTIELNVQEALKLQEELVHAIALTLRTTGGAGFTLPTIVEDRSTNACGAGKVSFNIKLG